MAENRSLTREITPAVAVVIGALLATFVALAVIEPSVAIIVAIFAFIFGGDLLRELAAALGTDERESVSQDEPMTAVNGEDALERLRTRYANGELSESEFERRLEVLLETETVADVERYLAARDEQAAGRATDDIDRELERSSG